MIHDTLFKRDRAGRIRFWRLESEGARFRTISGIWPDGAEVVSGWTVCVPRFPVVVDYHPDGRAD